MEILNTVNAIDGIYCEGYAIQALLAYNTCKASWMVGLAGGS